MISGNLCDVSKDEREPEEAGVRVRLQHPVAGVRVHAVHGRRGRVGGGGPAAHHDVADLLQRRGRGRRARVRVVLGHGVAGAQVQADADHAAVAQPTHVQLLQGRLRAPGGSALLKM